MLLSRHPEDDNRSFRILQQRLHSSVILTDTSTALRRLQPDRCDLVLIQRGLLQPLGIRRVSVLGLAVLVVTIAEAEGVMVVRFRIGCYGGQGLPLLAACFSLQT